MSNYRGEYPLLLLDVIVNIEGLWMAQILPSLAIVFGPTLLTTYIIHRLGPVKPK